MAKQTINVGTLANDGTGDPARTAFGKCNSNFDELYAGAGSQATTLTGDVTGTGTGSFVATIANNAVSNAKAAQMAAGTIKGNNTGATANQLDLTAAQVQAMVGLPTSTTAGRLARYTDATGAQGQTTGLHEDVNGNVGIGTTAPASVLDVSGSQAGKHGIVARYTRSIGNSDYPLSVQNDTGLTTFAIGANQTTSEGHIVLSAPTGQGSVGIDFFSDVGGTTKSGTFQMDSAGSMVFRQSTAGSMYFDYISGVYFRDSAYATRAFIANGTGNSYFNGGNVGIGTTSPATTLDVNGPIKAKSYTVATLPAAATVGAGTHAYVTDAASTFALGLGGTVSGGGGNFSRVTSDGSNWKQM